jgi:DNA-binding beta-propeller fold protein YncE
MTTTRNKFYLRRGVLGIAAASLLTLLAAGSPAAAKVSGPSPAAAFSASAPTSDPLYVGDAADNTIKQFDAQAGTLQGTFTGGSLHGPRGILHLGDGRFLVANQNVGLPVAGEIDQFDGAGKSLGALVPSSDPHAPFAPRGIILGPDKHTLYVADIGKDNIGAVEKYDVNSGKFLGKLNFDKWANSSASNGEFHPRGLVVGPDGRLYLSLFSEKDFQHLGWVLSYDLQSGGVTLVASSSPAADSTDCHRHLHRPEGLAFGPDGRLYVTSFRANPSDIDRILMFDTATGACADELDLDQVNQPRAYAQYILFGPGGQLFVPITGDPPNAGAVRQYALSTKSFTNLVAPGGPLGSGWGLTFAQTNPTTLAYPSS